MWLNQWIIRIFLENNDIKYLYSITGTRDSQYNVLNYRYFSSSPGRESEEGSGKGRIKRQVAAMIMMAER